MRFLSSKKSKSIVTALVKKDEADINQEIAQILQNQERLEFEFDYRHFSQEEDVKPKEIGQPFLLEKDSHDTCVITIHGFSSAPKEVEQLSLYLFAKGF